MTQVKRNLRSANLFRLAAHRFHSAFRRPPEGSSWLELFKQLTEQRTAREMAFAKGFSWVTVLFVVIAATGLSENLSVKTVLVEFSIPKIYLVFALAALTFFNLLDLLGSLFVVECQRRIVNRIRRFGNAGLLSLPYYSNAIWAQLFIAHYEFFRAPKLASFGQWALLLTVMVPAALIYLGVYTLVILQIILFLSQQSSAFMGMLFAAVSLLFLLAPPVLFFVAFRPVELVKNEQAIRWGFLFRLHLSHGGEPPNVDAWLSPAGVPPK